MPIVIALLVAVVIGAGIVINTSADKNLNSSISANVENIKTITNTSSPTPISSSEPSPTNTTTPTMNPTKTITPKLSPTHSINLTDEWVYPGAHGQSGNTYTSSDSPEDITEWYKQKIKSMNLNINTFVSTNSNDQVKNRLSASGNGKTIDVQINRPARSATVELIISVSNN